MLKYMLGRTGMRAPLIICGKYACHHKKKNEVETLALMTPRPFSKWGNTCEKVKLQKEMPKSSLDLTLRNDLYFTK